MADKDVKKSLFQKISDHIGAITIILYISGIVTFGVMITEPNVDKTYFSDNALLPGLVNREFTIIPGYVDQLQETLRVASKKSSSIPVSVLMSTLRSAGLEVYAQNFTLNYPFRPKSKFRGTNVYGILRAPRAPSTEAIVLSTPFRNANHVHGSTIPSVVLMASLAKYFAKGNYWAKDIIFLIADHELIGFKAWLDAYHGIDSGNILDRDSLEAVAGSIQASVNLEIKGTKVSHLNLKIEGLNGQLPNLDLFNVAVELATRESVTPTFHGSSHVYSSKDFEVWKQYATTIGSMMVSQASTLPTGAHGLFQKFAIQSLTLESVPSRKSQSYSVSLLQIGRVVEGLFRSLNNLLEKFNRSFWFYLLPSTRRYLSIGYYMIPFGLITIPAILMALKIYVQVFPGEHVELRIDEAGDNNSPSSDASLRNAFGTCFICHCLGLILLSLPHVIEQYDHYIPANFEIADTIYYTIIASTLVCMINPLALQTKSKKEETKMNCALIIALLNYSLLISCLSLINISLALFLSLVYTPILCLVTSWRNSNIGILFKSLLILLHPLAIHFFCLLGLCIHLHLMEGNQTLLTCLIRSFHVQKKSLVYLIEDWYLHGNWTYILATSSIFPIWLQFWTTL